MPTIGSLAELNEAQQFQLLVNAVGDYALYLVDPAGCIVSWNSGGQNIFGYRAAEIVGQHFSRFFPAEDRASGVPAEILRRAGAAGRYEGEGWRIGRDGRRFLAAVTIDAIRDAQGELRGFAIVTHDIAERREAQEALRASEEQLRLLVEGVTDYALYMLDPSGIVVSWNAGAQRLKGYEASEILGQHFSRFYSEEDRAAGLPQHMLDTAAREGQSESEGWRVRKDGSRFWASASIDAIRNQADELLGFAKVTHDITERRAAQDALFESEQQLRLLIDGVRDCALYMLDPGGIVISWNAGAARLKGYGADEIVGQHFSHFYAESDRAAGVPARNLEAAAQGGSIEAEGWRMRKDGSLFWAHVVISALRDDAGGLVGFAKITRDITDRREAQIARQNLQAQRNYAQKIEALGQLTGGVAHDFNNLLMIVSGHIERIKRLVAQDPSGRRASEAIELAANRGAALTRQLLSFARRQRLNPVVVTLRERIEAVGAMLATPLGGAVRLAIDVPPTVWPVEVDVGEFELAVVNIALNSRDAMPHGGVVTISAANVELTPNDTAERLAGDFVALTIADTGCGIAADILPRVFDPFFTTKPHSQGTGLGLSQVHGFAHQSGGTVTIASELGKGTRLTLYLPRTPADATQAIADPAAAAAVNGTALLVEDNPDVAEVTAALLEELGYRVHASENAEAAIAAAARRSFDLVVSDIVMAGAIDGIGLARRLRQRHPDLPIVLVTGYSDAALAGDSEFTVLRKPYRLAELSRAVAKVIAAAPPSAPSNLVHLRDARRPGRNERGS